MIETVAALAVYAAITWATHDVMDVVAKRVAQELVAAARRYKQERR